MDETWVCYFSPESKLQSKQWKHPGSRPPKTVPSAGKVIASIFWDADGILMVDLMVSSKGADN